MQELRRKININGEDFLLAVSQHGEGPPVIGTLGKPGVLYLDTEVSPERLYICTAANVEAGVYTWRPIEELLKITASGDTTVVPGEDGITPHIGENGNWYLGDIDTGVKAAGTDGDDGGYYSPEITPNEADNSFTITFKASKSGMPAVAPATIKLPEKSNDSGENVNHVEPAWGDIPKVFLSKPLQATKTEVVCKFWYYSKTLEFRCYAKIKAQGNSTMMWPKKSQTIKLYEDEACTEKMKIDLNGWGKQNKFVIKAYWTDLTHCRDIGSVRLESECAKSRTHYADMPELLRTSPNMGAVDGFPVVVYADGVYQGRYMWNIPKGKWMANMDEDLDTHCILFSESYGSCLFRAEAIIDGSDWTDELHDTVPASIKNRWNEVINFVQTSTNEEFVANLDNYIDVESLIDRHIIGLLSCDLAGYGGNQMYLTYDGQKWYAVPYDKDITWGNSQPGLDLQEPDFEREQYADMLEDRGGNLLFMRLEELFIDRLYERWCYLKEHELSVANIIHTFRNLADITPPHLIPEDYATTTAGGAYIDMPGKDVSNIQQIQQFAVGRHKWTEEYLHSKFVRTNNRWNLQERTEYRASPDDIEGNFVYFADMVNPLPLSEDMWINGAQIIAPNLRIYSDIDEYAGRFVTFTDVTSDALTLNGGAYQSMSAIFPFHLNAGETIKVVCARNDSLYGGYVLFDADGTYRSFVIKSHVGASEVAEIFTFTATDECWFAWVVSRYETNVSTTVSNIEVTIS